MSDDNKNPRVILFVEGGVCHDVICDGPVEVILVDYDTDGLDEVTRVTYPNGDGNDARVSRFGPDNSNPYFEHYWKQLVKP